MRNLSLFVDIQELELIKTSVVGLSSSEKDKFTYMFSDRKRGTGMGIALALLVGFVGVHQFWLRDNRKGIIYLLCGTIGWLPLAIPVLIISIFCIVDAFQMKKLVYRANREIAAEIVAEIEILRD